MQYVQYVFFEKKFMRSGTKPEKLLYTWLRLSTCY